jgi:hypothetical protein
VSSRFELLTAALAEVTVRRLTEVQLTFGARGCGAASVTRLQTAYIADLSGAHGNPWTTRWGRSERHCYGYQRPAIPGDEVAALVVVAAVGAAALTPCIPAAPAASAGCSDQRAGRDHLGVGQASSDTTDKSYGAIPRLNPEHSRSWSVDPSVEVRGCFKVDQALLNLVSRWHRLRASDSRARNRCRRVRPPDDLPPTLR